MIIKIIDDIQQFDQVKPNWEEVFAADPDATIFTSWGWIRGWIDTKCCDWSILAVQPDVGAPYVAFMPLGIHRNQKGAIDRLFLGASGHPGADNTGFVCLPEYAEEAIPAFGGFIQKNINWGELDLRSVFDPRLDLFLEGFCRGNFSLVEHESNPCPWIMLPGSWDEYVSNYLSKTTRKNLLGYAKKIEKIKNFRVTHARKDTLTEHIEALLGLWQERFGQKAENILNAYRAIYLRSFESDCLLLTMFWDGTIPIAGKAAFVGKKRKTITAFTTAFNEKYADYRPGNVLTAYVIRYAIENGFRVYDFGEGGEKHKFSFGAAVRFNRNIRIVRNTFLAILKGRVPAKIKPILREALNKIMITQVLIIPLINLVEEDDQLFSGLIF